MIASAWQLFSYQNKVMTSVQELSASFNGKPESGGHKATLAESDQFAQIMAANVAASGLGLNACGLRLGMALAFMGLAIFLYEIPGTLDADAEVSGWKVKFTRLSPGAACLVCSTIIIIFSLSHRPHMQFSPRETQVWGKMASEPRPLP